MSVKDHKIQYAGLGDPACVVQTPNTVSRSMETGDRSLYTVVFQSGKAVLDSELQLKQGAPQEASGILDRWQTPSGWLRGVMRRDGYTDYTMGIAPAGIVDDSPNPVSIGSVGADDFGFWSDRTMINCFLLPRLEAKVAGMPIVVEYNYTRTPGWNIIPLASPQIYDGTSTTVKRTDFIFLEVWKTLVAPSPKASASIQVTAVGAGGVVAGDWIRVNGILPVNQMTASAAPGVNQFLVPAATVEAQAIIIADAFNNPANTFSTVISARASGDTVLLEAVVPGAGTIGPPGTGNFISLAVSVANPGSLAPSGASFSGGADRPNKPDQAHLWRHGNVCSPAPVWLPDDLMDPVVDTETTQRIQVQYQVRRTGIQEGVNYKKHPDGFSNLFAGPPPTPGIFAQAARTSPAANYPFVQADKTKVWLNSSAVEYDIRDDGLWIAGDGSEQAAIDLGAADGFVYAIPICFVHRHNDVSSQLAGWKGFDPVENTNGAPRYGHPGYNGPLGPIPAGLSDRPDGHFCDVVVQDNLLDLRRHIAFPGWDLASELQYQIHSLLDGSTRTWSVDTASKQVLGGDSGDVSTQFLVCNEIGRSNALGGAFPVSGDTPRGEFIRNFDHIARRFGDQPVIERVVFSFWPGDRLGPLAQGGPVPPGTVNAGKYAWKAESAPGVPMDADAWYEGDVLHVDLEFLGVSTLGVVFQGGQAIDTYAAPNFFNSFAPVGTVITDVLSVYHDDGHFTAAVDQQVKVLLIQGLGTTHLEVTLDKTDTEATGGLNVAPYHMAGRTILGFPRRDGSPRRIFVELEITYPLGSGTTDTPDFEVVPDPVVYDGSGPAGPGPIIENAPGQQPLDMEALLAPGFRPLYREVKLEYVANETYDPAGPAHPGVPVGDNGLETIVSRDRRNLYFPRRVYGARAQQTAVIDLSVPVARPIDQTLTEYGSSSRKVVLSQNLAGTGQTLCEIKYFPQDAIPNYGVLGGGYQVAVYFRSRVPQTAGVKEGDIMTTGDGVCPTLLTVDPLLISPEIWTGQTGVGSLDQGFPWLLPGCQIPILDGSPLDPVTVVAGTTREWYFCATTSVTIDDFNANTGLLSLHPFVQVDSQHAFDFGGLDNWKTPRKDAEFRAFYPFADDTVYRPTMISQPLFGAVRHKVFFPFLARIVDEVPGVAGGLLFRRNELVLVVLTRFAALDDNNAVRFLDPHADNRTCAAVYRTRHLIMLVGDRA